MTSAAYGTPYLDTSVYIAAIKGEAAEPGRGKTSIEVLTDAEATELARIALDIEAGLGRPVDLEAARYGDRWILLQARPITTGH